MSARWTVQLLAVLALLALAMPGHAQDSELQTEEPSRSDDELSTHDATEASLENCTQRYEGCVSKASGEDCADWARDRCEQRASRCEWRCSQRNDPSACEDGCDERAYDCEQRVEQRCDERQEERLRRCEQRLENCERKTP